MQLLLLSLLFVGCVEAWGWHWYPRTSHCEKHSSRFAASWTREVDGDRKGECAYKNPDKERIKVDSKNGQGDTYFSETVINFNPDGVFAAVYRKHPKCSRTPVACLVLPNRTDTLNYTQAEAQLTSRDGTTNLDNSSLTTLELMAEDITHLSPDTVEARDFDPIHFCNPYPYPYRRKYSPRYSWRTYFTTELFSGTFPDTTSGGQEILTFVTYDKLVKVLLPACRV